MHERLQRIRRYRLDMHLREIQARADRDRDTGIFPELETREQLANRAIEGADDRALLLFEIRQLLKEKGPRGASDWEVLAAMAVTAIAVIAMPYCVDWITSLW